MIREFFMLSIIFSFAMTGCATKEVSKQPQEVADFKICTDPRPEMYLTVQDPVCAKVIDGSKVTYETISNSGAACANKKVVGYSKGECKADKNKTVIKK